MKPDYSPTQFNLHRHIRQCQHWIFDMDGTLTLAQHDFEAIRRELGLPGGKPILEALDDLPQAQARRLHQKLDAIELEIAAQSKAAPGAALLLETLCQRGCKLGILTRNNAINIEVTLKAAGLLDFFQAEYFVSRGCTPPKPQPDGIFRLLDLWQANADQAIMIGDHRHDLLAGQAAGTPALYIDPTGQFIFQEDADLSIQSLEELVGIIF